MSNQCADSNLVNVFLWMTSFTIALSRTDPSKEPEPYFVISNFVAKLKVIIPLQQFLQGMKKCTLLIAVASFSVL